MRKGFYWIITHDTDNQGNTIMIPALEEGSYEYHGKLLIHREKDYRHNPQKWKVSHVDSGASVTGERCLAGAREIAKKLQGIPLWDIETYADICAACTSPSYEDQVIKIKRVLGLIK